MLAIESMVFFLRYTLQRFGRFFQFGGQFLGAQVALFGFRLLSLLLLDHSEPIPCGSNSRLVLGRLVSAVLPEGLSATRIVRFRSRGEVSNAEVRGHVRGVQRERCFVFLLRRLPVLLIEQRSTEEVMSLRGPRLLADGFPHLLGRDIVFLLNRIDPRVGPMAVEGIALL